MKHPEAIRQEVGSALYSQWREQAKHEYDRAKVHDLTRAEYEAMHIQWRYAHFKESEFRLRLSGGVTGEERL